MKTKRSKKNGSLQIIFGERSEDAKFSKFSKLKSKDKIYKQLARGLYKGGRVPFETRNLTIRIEGGYSKSQVRRREKMGIESDEKYFFGFTTPVNVNYTPSEIKNQVEKAMKDFTELVAQNSEKYGLVADPRIYRVQVDFNYMDKNMRK